MTFANPGDPDALARSVREAFEERYATPAAAVGRAPGRVNLMGEHTDYNAGLCLPVALPHATYAALRPREDRRVRIVSAQRDDAWEADLADVAPGAVEGWAAYAAGVLWALADDGVDVPGLDVLVDSTVPIGSGLSSSAALECAVGVALAGLLDLPLDRPGRERLREAGIRAETEVVGAPTGGLDQSAAMLAEAGSAVLLDFAADTAEVAALDLDGLTLLVTDTRVAHELTDGGYAARRAECEAAARALGVATLREADAAAVETLVDEVQRRRARHIVAETARVPTTLAALAAGDAAETGRLFLTSHASMRDDFEISSPELDAAVVTAVEAGAHGARMTGGGFGGASVALVPTDRVQAVARAIDARFVLDGFRSPVHLVAAPGAGADLR